LSYEKLIKAAMGRDPFDLLIKNTQLVNIYTGEIYHAAIGIVGDRIAYVDEGSKSSYHYSCRAKFINYEAAECKNI